MRKILRWQLFCDLSSSPERTDVCKFPWVLLQHWIRLEMQPDVLIQRLYMRVEPSDSSYMPSLVVVSGGESVHTLRELKTVNIGSSETLVTLLQDVTEVRREGPTPRQGS